MWGVRGVRGVRGDGGAAGAAGGGDVAVSSGTSDCHGNTPPDTPPVDTAIEVTIQ